MIYWNYFKYIVEHKLNVGIECLKACMFTHAITHDMSKFRLSEFIPYAKFFAAKNRGKEYKTSDEKDPNFLRGWCLHQKCNKHHWNYWVCITRKDEVFPVPMPLKYVLQMVADWKGMSRKFGGEAKEYYQDNVGSMILHDDTKRRIQSVLYIST